MICIAIIAGIGYAIPYYKYFYMRSGTLEGTALEIHSNSGFDKTKLESLTTFLKESTNSTSLVVLKDGKVAYSYGDVSEVSYLASCRKSVLAMLYGKYVENGTIVLNETIGSIGIDENDGLLPIEKQATVDHIITSRSGVFHVPANGGYDEKNIKKRGSKQPGEYFVYNNWDFNVAGHILEIKTGHSVYDEIEEQLAIPLEFEDWNLKNQRRTVNEEKSRYSAYHMYFSTRDMAKIGQLMLNEGQWDDEQLISKQWINRITSTVTPRDTVNKRIGANNKSAVQFSYGYMWWLFENFKSNPDMEGAYSATGFGGQYITVIPKLNMVIAHKKTLGMLYHMGFGYDVADWQYYKIVEKVLELDN